MVLFYISWDWDLQFIFLVQKKYNIYMQKCLNGMFRIENDRLGWGFQLYYPTHPNIIFSTRQRGGGHTYCLKYSPIEHQLCLVPLVSLTVMCMIGRCLLLDPIQLQYSNIYRHMENLIGSARHTKYTKGFCRAYFIALYWSCMLRLQKINQQSSIYFW